MGKEVSKAAATAHRCLPTVETTERCLLTATVESRARTIIRASSGYSCALHNTDLEAQALPPPASGFKHVFTPMTRMYQFVLALEITPASKETAGEPKKTHEKTHLSSSTVQNAADMHDGETSTSYVIMPLLIQSGANNGASGRRHVGIKVGSIAAVMSSGIQPMWPGWHAAASRGP